MSESDEKALFALVGIKPAEQRPAAGARRARLPIASLVVFGTLIAGAALCGYLTGDPSYMDLAASGEAPSAAHWFGTDMMGRDLFAMIWHGGRVSLFVGTAAGAVSTLIALIYGAAAGCAGPRVDAAMMRAVEILLSVPSLLLVILLQAALGKASAVSLPLVIGATSWMSISKIVRTETRRIRASEYVTAARCMGASFAHILRRHLAPNFISAIMFMVVMNIRSAIFAESTLSFIGIGLPIEVSSWGSILSLSESALLAGLWWVVFIPGAFLVAALLAITGVGNWLRGRADTRGNNFGS